VDEADACSMSGGLISQVPPCVCVCVCVRREAAGLTWLEDERAAELDVAGIARRCLAVGGRKERADLEGRRVADGLKRAKLEAHRSRLGRRSVSSGRGERQGGGGEAEQQPRARAPARVGGA
jgi:hypothetical protein